MTNREKLLNTNEYDLLLRIQKFLTSTSGKCVLDAISFGLPEFKSTAFLCSQTCEECLQQWLNTEEGSSSLMWDKRE